MSQGTLSVKIAEPPSGSKGTLFFLPGFPDRHNSFFDTLVPELSKDYRCIVACLPDYERRTLGRFFGYDGREIAARIGRTIDALSPDEPVALVLHDWGSVYGLDWYAANPSRVTRLVCLDVFMTGGILETTEGSPRALFWMLVYQGWLAQTFLAGRVLPPLGNLLLLLLRVLKLGPDLAPPPPGVLCPPEGPRWHLCYPYVREWADKVRGEARRRIELSGLCPVLYAYGLRKRVMFHSERDLAAMAADPKHKVIAYDCGHWVQHAKTDELVEEIRAFVGR